jgi:hypothetical protein
MTISPSPRLARSGLSPAARSLRIQRIFARMQDGAGYAEIAAEEGLSRERLRQIILAATRRGRQYEPPDHKRMQIARLTPALRLASESVAQGDAKAIPLLLQIVDRLDRYSARNASFDSPWPGHFEARRGRKSARRGEARPGYGSAADAPGRSMAAPPLFARTFDEDGMRGPDCLSQSGQAIEKAQNGNG